MHPIEDGELVYGWADAGEEKRAALALLDAAFEEARAEGIDGDCIAQAAIFTALADMVDCYGEDAVAVFTETLPGKVRGGAYTVTPRH